VGLFETHYQLADRPPSSTNFEVSFEHAAQAARWCEYLESHARRIYGCLTTSRVIAARELGLRIRQGKLGREFSARDLYRKGWTCLESVPQADGAIEVLLHAEWVRLAPNQPETKGKQRLPIYEVNPLVFAG
jgi:hypothetical protein